MTVIIRPAGNLDRTAVEQLVSKEAAAGRVLPRAFTPADFLVAEVSGRVQGTLSLTAWSPEVLELGTVISALPRHRIGDRLVQAGLDHAARTGHAWAVVLTAIPGFFSRQGFDPVETTPWARARGPVAPASLGAELDHAIGHKAQAPACAARSWAPFAGADGAAPPHRCPGLCMSDRIEIPASHPVRIPGGGFLVCRYLRASHMMKGNGQERADVAVFVAPGVGLRDPEYSSRRIVLWTRARVPGPVHAVVVNAAPPTLRPASRANDNAAMANAAAETLGCDPDTSGLLDRGHRPPDGASAARIRGSRWAPRDRRRLAHHFTTDRSKAGAVQRGGITVGGVAKGWG